MKKIIIISIILIFLGIAGIALAAVQYDWILGEPVQTDNTNFEWVLGMPYILQEAEGGAAGISVSGTVYTDDDEVTPLTVKTVCLRVNGTLAGTGDGGTGLDDTDGSGNFSFTSVSASAGDTITLYLDDETEKANTITITDGSTTITGAKLYQNHVVLRSDNGSTAITILDLVDWDNDNDATDMLFTATDATPDTLSVEAGIELFITSGEPFTPGGNVTVGTGDLDLNGTWTESGTETLTIGGNFDSTGGTFTAQSGTVVFDADATGKTITAGGGTFYNLVFDSGAGTGAWTLQSAVTATNITLTDGTLTDNGQTVTANGNISIANTSGILTSTGTWVQGASGNVANPTANNKFATLQIANSVISTRTNTVRIKKLVLGSNAVLQGDNGLIIYEEANDFINMGSGSSITVGSISIYTTNSATHTQKAFSTSVAVTIWYGYTNTIQMTGNWTTGNLWIHGNYIAGTEAEAQVLDTNGYNLTANGNLTLGNADVADLDAYRGKILFSSGTHSISGDISVDQGTYTTDGYFNLGSATISAGGGWDMTDGTVTPSTSTVTFNASSGTKDIVSVGQSFNNLQVNASGATIELEDALDINGTLTITAGTLDTKTGENNSINVGGNWSKTGGTFTAQSGTVVFDGGNQSITGSTTFNNFYKADSTNDATDLTLTFDNTATQVIQGLLTLDGLDADDRINLVSDSPGTQWSLTCNGTFAIDYVDVTDSDASGGTTISHTNTVNGGNNLNWGFAAGIYVAGTAYLNDETTTIGSDYNVALRVNGGNPYTTTTNYDGDWSFSNVSVSSGDTLTIYLYGASDDASGVYTANIITITDGTNISGLPLIADHVVISSNNGSTAITIADLVDYDNDQNWYNLLFDADLGSPNTLSTDYQEPYDAELYIMSGALFTPGGTVTANLGIKIMGTWTATGTESIICNMSEGGVCWTVDPAGVFTAASSTVTFGTNWAGVTIVTGGTDDNHDFNNVVVNLGISTRSFKVQSYDMDIDGNLTLASGLLSLITNVYLAGNLIIDSTNVGTAFDYSGDLVFDGTSLQTISNSVGETETVADEVQISNSTGVQLSHAVTFAVTTINSGGIFDIDGKNFTSGTTFTNNGTFKWDGDETISTPTLGSGSTVEYTDATGVAIQNWNYSASNLTISGAGSFTLPAALDVVNLTISAGALDVTASNFQVNCSGTWSNSGTFTAQSGTVVFDGGNQSITGSTTFNNFYKADSTNDATDLTLTFDNTGTQVIQGLLTLDGLDADDRVNLVSNLPGTQWSLTCNGTFAIDYVDVTDSDASGGTTISHTNTVDGGNNLNWGFPSEGNAIFFGTNF